MSAKSLLYHPLCGWFLFTKTKKPVELIYRPLLLGDPGGIRTPDPRLRRPLLYPTELLNHINLERAMGIEPTTSAWKAEVLPLNYTRMVGVAGFEPATPCSQGRCATKLRYTPNTKDIILVFEALVKDYVLFLAYHPQ